MKRDWNLLRDIMAAIEEDRFATYVEQAGNNENWMDGLDTDGIKQERFNRLRTIDGHVRLLIDAGLISKINSDNAETLQLSMEGHDMLQHMRDPNVWHKIKDFAHDSGVSLTLDFIKACFPKIWERILNA